jgi:type IV pilus assembly protein PilV
MDPNCVKVVKNERGFTLGEVLVAMIILAVALLALAKMQIRSLEAGDFSSRMSIALALAQDKIEEFQDTSLADIVDGSDTVTVQGSTGGVTRFTREWTVDSSTWGTNTRQVTVTVRWLNYDVTLNSIISE